MRILQVIPYYLPSTGFGGPITVLSSLIATLSLQKHTITVVTTDITENGGRIPISKEIIDGAEVIRFRNVFPTLAIHFSFYTPFSYFWYIKKEIKQFDVIHIHDFFTLQNVVTSMIAHREHIPVIIQPHGAAVPITSRGRVFIKTVFLSLFGKQMLRHAAAIVCISEDEKQRIAAYLPDVTKKLIVIPNSVALHPTYTATDKSNARKILGIHNNAIVIFTLSRLHKIKRIDRIIRSFALLHKKQPNTLLLIAGPDAGEKNRLMKLMDSLHIAQSVRFVGGVYEKEKEHYFQASDVFVSLSNDDPFGLSVLEALSHHLPVCIAPSIGIARDIEAFGCGIITKHPDTASEVARTLLHTYTKRAQYRSNIPQLFKHFDPEKTNSLYLSLYTKLTSYRMKPKNCAI